MRYDRKESLGCTFYSNVDCEYLPVVEEKANTNGDLWEG